MPLRFLGIGMLLLGLAGCTTPRKTGELPPEKESVLQAVNSHVGDVSDCYTAALKKNPKLNGKLILEWEINPIGDAKDVKVIQSVEPKLDQCISKRLMNWAFSPPPENKIARVRYPFVFAPVVDPVDSVKTKTMETVAVAPPSLSKMCPQIESEYAALCVRDENSGECVLDEKQMGEMLQIMRSSPKFQLSYLAEVDKMLKNPKPTQAEAEAIIAKLAEDCWTAIHVRMWNSIFHTFKNIPTHSRVAEAKEVLGERTTGLDVHSPTLLALSQDQVILERAIESGFIKPKPAAKKNMTLIRFRTKSLVKLINNDWHGGKPPTADQLMPVPPVATDPVKVITLIRKELKAVKPIRAQLKEWSKKNWKKF